MSRVEGRAALVTGAARAIGAQVALAQADVTSRTQWDNAAETAVAAYGTRNVLVNNAGVSIPGHIDEYCDADRDKSVAIGLTGVSYGVSAAVPAVEDMFEGEDEGDDK